MLTGKRGYGVGMRRLMVPAHGTPHAHPVGLPWEGLCETGPERGKPRRFCSTQPPARRLTGAESVSKGPPPRTQTTTHAEQAKCSRQVPRTIQAQHYQAKRRSAHSTPHSPRPGCQVLPLEYCKPLVSFSRKNRVPSASNKNTRKNG